MRIDVLTLFPEIFQGFFASSLIGKAIDRNLVDVALTNFRDYALDKHRTVDDAPYGGGHGMVLKVEPLYLALKDLLGEKLPDRKIPSQSKLRSGTRVVLLCPQGEPYTQQKAEFYAGLERLVLICGHYEGFDERIRQHLVDEELSIGDYVLTGGEVPAMVVMDSLVRLLPDVLGNEESAKEDSFTTGYLEYPQYTRPAEFHHWQVPEVLLSGDHRLIKRWRSKESLRRTWKRRPQLLKMRLLNPEEQLLLQEVIREEKDGSEFP